MGKMLSRFQEMFAEFGTNPARILMLGLDAAGKTTILYKVKLDEEVATVPTVGFNVETVAVCKGVTFTVWDVGGQEKLRRLWNLYFKGTHGVIFVVDSADRDRIPECRVELLRMCKNEELRGVPLIVIANKQDLPDALSTSDIADGLCLGQIKDRYWYVQPACATRDDGVVEAMDFMATLVKEHKRNQRLLRRNSIGR